LETLGGVHDLIPQLVIARLVPHLRQNVCDVGFVDFASRRRRRRRLIGGTEPQSPWIELQQARRLRGGIAELKTKFEGGNLGRRPREQQVTVADRMQSAGAAEGAANLVAADGFADMMHHHQSGAGRVPQAQQGLAQRRHGARVVFVLIVGGVEQVENDDFGGGGSASEITTVAAHSDI